MDCFPDLNGRQICLLGIPFCLDDAGSGGRRLTAGRAPFERIKSQHHGQEGRGLEGAAPTGNNASPERREEASKTLGRWEQTWSDREESRNVEKQKKKIMIKTQHVSVRDDGHNLEHA